MSPAPTHVRLLLLTACLSLPGCLTLRDDTEEAENKRQISNQVSSMQKGHAESESRINQTESELRQLNGRIETLEHKIALMTEAESKQDQASKSKQDELVAQMKAFEEELAHLQQSLNDLKADIANKSQPPKEDPKSGATIDEGEEYFANKNWKKAITAYNHYIEKNPKGKKVPEATYKIGVCFQELGMKAEAKTFFKEVISKFPKDPTSKRATFRLNQLKK